MSRVDRQQVAGTIWRDLGAIDNDMVRREFIDVMERIGMSQITAPKTLRHTFATSSRTLTSTRTFATN
jgi:hypothetical protein